MTQQLGLAFASAAFSMPSTPATGRAARRPDRTQQQVQQQQPEEPSIAVDFTRSLSPEEMEDVRAYADRVVPQLQDRAAARDDDPEMQARYLRKYAAGMALVAARLLRLAERKPTAAAKGPELTNEPAPAKPKRGPGRPKKAPTPLAADKPTSGGPRMPPVPRLGRPAEESEAPVPAGPRRPQPTAQEVLDRRPSKPPQRAGRVG